MQWRVVLATSRVPRLFPYVKNVSSPNLLNFKAGRSPFPNVGPILRGLHMQTRNPPMTLSCFTIATHPDQPKISEPDIIKAIQPVDVGRGFHRLVCLLTTSNYWNAIDGDPQFLSALLKKLFPGLVTGDIGDLIVAVVDFVPLPAPTPEPNDSPESVSRNANLGDGISVAVIAEKSSKSPVWHRTSSRSVSPPGDPGILSFRFSNIEQQELSLHMPLANTIFTNGRPNTMRVQRWKMKGQTGEDPGLTLERGMDLTDLTLDLLNADNGSGRTSAVGIQSHLRRFTPPRAVQAVTGNILRQLDGEEGTPQPASRELEIMIDQQFRTGQVKRGSLEIFALVEPQICSETSIVGSPIDLKSTFMQGGRLYKVLSGGGGWGEKQGLLALEPSSWLDQQSADFQDRDEDSKTGFFDSIVRRGEFITFAVNDAASERLATPLSNYQDHDLSLNFGCAESGMDDGSNETGKGTTMEGHKPFTYASGLFGMLSTRGIYLQSKDTDTLHSELDPVRQRRTKIDASSSTVSILSDISSNAFGDPQVREKSSKDELQEATKAATELASLVSPFRQRHSVIQRQRNRHKIRLVPFEDPSRKIRESQHVPEALPKMIHVLTHQRTPLEAGDQGLSFRKHLVRPKQGLMPSYAKKVPSALKDAIVRQEYGKALLQGQSSAEALEKIKAPFTGTWQSWSPNTDNNKRSPAVHSRNHNSLKIIKYNSAGFRPHFVG